MLGNSVSRPFIVVDFSAFAEALIKMNEDFQHLCDVRLHIVNLTECKVRIETTEDWPNAEEHGLEEVLPDFDFNTFLASHLADGQCAVLETSYPRQVGYTDQRISPYWEVRIVHADGTVVEETSDRWVEAIITEIGGDSDLNNQT